MARKELAQSLSYGRGYFLQVIDGLSEEQLLKVADNTNQNILWNIGHVVHSLYGMTYGSCKLDYPGLPEWPEQFKGGSSPATWEGTPDVAAVMEHFKSSAAKVGEDLNAGVFDGFDKVELGPFTFTSIEQLLQFHLYHEGIHLGMVMTLKKLI